MVDPNKEPVFELICDSGVFSAPTRGSMYQIFNLEEIAAFLDKFAAPEFKHSTHDQMIFQIAPEAFVTLQTLPLYPLSTMEALIGGLQARGYLIGDAA